MLFSQQHKANEKIWACLIHLSFNMWEEYISPHRPFRGYRPDLELSESLWNDAVSKMAREGMNMVVIDLGDAIKYESHPEIAVKNALNFCRVANLLRSAFKASAFASQLKSVYFIATITAVRARVER